MKRINIFLMSFKQYRIKFLNVSEKHFFWVFTFLHLLINVNKCISSHFLHVFINAMQFVFLYVDRKYNFIEIFLNIIFVCKFLNEIWKSNT